MLTLLPICMDFNSGYGYLTGAGWPNHPRRPRGVARTAGGHRACRALAEASEGALVTLDDTIAILRAVWGPEPAPEPED